MLLAQLFASTIAFTLVGPVPESSVPEVPLAESSVPEPSAELPDPTLTEPAEPPEPAAANDSAVTPAQPDPQPPAPAASAPLSEMLTAQDVPIPRKTGIGLMATSGALAVLGFGLMGLRMSIIKNKCTISLSDDEVTVEEIRELIGAGIGCEAARGTAVAVFLVEGTANMGNWAVASAAGALRGKYDAARDIADGRQRKDIAWIAAGAGVLAAGAIGRVAVAVDQIQRPPVTRCEDEQSVDEFFDCFRRRSYIHYGGQQLTSSAMAVGAGMLAYGLSYRISRRKLASKYEGISFRVVPELGLKYNGATAVLNF